MPTKLKSPFASSGPLLRGGPTQEYPLEYRESLWNLLQQTSSIQWRHDLLQRSLFPPNCLVCHARCLQCRPRTNVYAIPYRTVADDRSIIDDRLSSDLSLASIPAPAPITVPAPTSALFATDAYRWITVSIRKPLCRPRSPVASSYLSARNRIIRRGAYHQEILRHVVNRHDQADCYDSV